MNTLEDIHAEVAELEAKRAHSVLLERSAKAIVEYAQGQITSARLDASVEAYADGRIEKRVIFYIGRRAQRTWIFDRPTLSEALRDVAQKFAPQKAEKQKGGVK